MKERIRGAALNALMTLYVWIDDHIVMPRFDPEIEEFHDSLLLDFAIWFSDRLMDLWHWLWDGSDQELFMVLHDAWDTSAEYLTGRQIDFRNWYLETFGYYDIKQIGYPHAGGSPTEEGL